MQLRDYQKGCLREAWRALNEHRSTVIVLPTGGGKTLVAAAMSLAIARQFSDRKCVALYLVHRKELIHQTAETLRSVGLDQFGIIASGVAESRWQPLQIASIQTLARRLDKVSGWLKPVIVFVDEAHHCRAKTWARLIDHFAPTSYLCGLTATPQRLDGKGLGEHFASMVLGPSTADLVERGYLADTRIFFPKTSLRTDGIKIERGDYSKRGLQDAMTGRVIAEGISHVKRLAHDRKCITYCVSVEDSKNWVERLRTEGYTAEHIDGTTPGDQRRQILDRFRRGDTQHLSNVDILTEGFDCPSCDCVIIRRPTKSLPLYKQMYGRMIRIKDDGRDGVFIDLAGCVWEHGPPAEAVEWSLEDGVDTEKQRSSRKASFKRCSECSFLYPVAASSCTFCGYSPEGVQVIETDVTLIEHEQAAFEERRKKRENRMSRRALNRAIIESNGDRDVLRALCEEHGYNPQSIHKWTQLFGRIWDKRRQARAA